MPAALLLSFLLLSQTPATVTYTTVAKSVDKVVADLSPLTNYKLTANPQAAREIVLISVKDIPVNDLLQKLAQATSCTWESDSGCYRLVPDPGLRNKEAQAEQAKEAATIAKSIAKQVADLTPKKEAPDNAGEGPGAIELTGMFGGGGPAETKAITKILALMDPNDLAAVGQGQRLVFASNNATNMQRSLPDGCADIVNEWMAEHNEAVKNMPKEDPTTDADNGQIPKQFLDMMKASRTLVNGPLNKALLVVSRTPLIDMLQVHLHVYNNQGAVVLQASSTLDQAAFSAIIAQAANAAKPKKQEEASKTPIEYSADSKAIDALQPSGMAMGMGGPMGGVKLSPDLKAKLLHPENFDPLAFQASDELLSVAKHENRQIVADVPDSFDASNAFEKLSSTATVEDVEKAIKSGDVVSSVDDGHVLVIKPAKAAHERLVRVERKSLAVLLGASEAKGAASLDDICAYALQNENPMTNGIAMEYASLFVPGLMGGADLFGAFNDWNMYRLYGSMTPDQRQAIVDGRPMPFSMLSDTQQAYASAIVFGSYASPGPDDAKTGLLDVFTRSMDMFGMSNTENYKTEPTELMPSGLPANGSITWSVANDPVFEPAEDGGKENHMTLGPETLALYKWASQMQAASGQGAGMTLPQKGRLGQRASYHAHFHIASNVSIEQVLTDVSIPKDGEIVSMSSLPADFKAKIDADLAEIQKSPLGAMAALGGGKEIHP